ncbi:MAG TPA: UDP-3-O-(3-hydroxymyristoyl)glucosamine N-acyltransferase [Devosia sp.]|nr:UDP-3-O-(3-hydroxymyristoyl)glucosamine N-acyltransferase [Devosia sp.]
MVDQRFFPLRDGVVLGDLVGRTAADFPDLDTAALGRPVRDAAPLDVAGPDAIALATGKKYAARLAQTRAGIVVVSPALADRVPEGCVRLLSTDAHTVFVRFLEYMYPVELRRCAMVPGDDAAGAGSLEDQVQLGANVVIGAGAEIGEGTCIGPNSTIGAGVRIGRNCRIGANVTVECALVGDEVSIAHGATVGTEGFGLLDHGRGNVRIPQLGRAILQDHVEVGPNSNIDRGALGDTVIGENSKLGALVEIGHNSWIGRNCLLAPTVGLAGGTTLEDGVLMGANAASAGHLTIGAGSVLHARASVTKDWPAGSMLAGAPAQDIKAFWRELAAVRKLAKGK